MNRAMEKRANRDGEIGSEERKREKERKRNGTRRERERVIHKLEEWSKSPAISLPERIEKEKEKERENTADTKQFISLAFK